MGHRCGIGNLTTVPTAPKLGSPPLPNQSTMRAESDFEMKKHRNQREDRPLHVIQRGGENVKAQTKEKQNRDQIEKDREE